MFYRARFEVDLVLGDGVEIYLSDGFISNVWILYVG